ncbi:monofunctional biosynthetic peptidoglycan transglycosylase [Actibacterium pelagium]|uniref:monofunctional biosynthetic peptidoglycan transglycosylase n=1 Tax=Actibacterium pelagium TaxID=2029103 RepID=UPI000BAAE77F|nr:monofunctional biosynthetic peptidoglycan transglycosylase [Actibacterium pelagium]
MAKQAKKPASKPAKTKTRKAQDKAKPQLLRRLRRWAVWGVLGFAAVIVLMVVALRFVNPPTTHTIWTQDQYLGGVKRTWVDIEDVAPEAIRAIVAAEDANFCTHWGFDMAAIRDALEDGANRGASTITQQTVKNVFLWQDRSWFRKSMEAVLTPLVEAVWPKRRIIEVYVNVAEFDEGVFGIEAAAQHYFGVSAAKLSPLQGASLAVILPNPKQRNATKLKGWMAKRATRLVDGAATIRADGRSACFDS